jgi:hypothetical protein
MRRCYRMVRKDPQGRDVFTKATNDEKDEARARRTRPRTPARAHTSTQAHR